MSKSIPAEDFPAHVADMHSNDDYRFSIEYPVCFFILRVLQATLK